jgi:hypothetical protein
MYKDIKDGLFTEDKKITHSVAGINDINISFYRCPNIYSNVRQQDSHGRYNSQYY